MLIVVSPAKSLDYETPLATKKHSTPEMLDRSAELVSVMAVEPSTVTRAISRLESNGLVVKRHC